MAGHVEAVGEQVELAEAGDELDRVLAAVPPVVDPRQDLVGERAGVGPGAQVLAGDLGELIDSSRRAEREARLAEAAREGTEDPA